MARVTVEDCVDKVENRFELVLLASHRARQISQGQPITIDRDNDKNPVVALREIADETLSPGDLKEDLIHSLQKHVEVDEPEQAPSAAPRPSRRVSRATPPGRTARTSRSPSTACPRKSCSPASRGWSRRRRPKITERRGGRPGLSATGIEVLY